MKVIVPSLMLATATLFAQNPNPPAAPGTGAQAGASASGGAPGQTGTGAQAGASASGGAPGQNGTGAQAGASASGGAPVSPPGAADPTPAARRQPGTGTAAAGNPQAALLPVVTLLDKDRNGEFSREEIANAAATLKALDTNRDGRVSREEIAALLKNGGAAGATEVEPVRPGTVEAQTSGAGTSEVQPSGSGTSEVQPSGSGTSEVQPGQPAPAPRR